MNLSTDQMIALVPADPAMLPEQLRRFQELAPTLFMEPGYVQRAVLEGFVTVTQVNVGNDPAYLIGWRKTDDGGLFVELAKSLSTRLSFELVLNAVDHIAHSQGCRYIRFGTHRRGLARKCLSAGYQPECIVMSKQL